MESEKLNDNEGIITTDPMEGAKICKRTGYPINGSVSNSDANGNDITQSDMFREFFGNDAMSQFNEIKRKENNSKPTIIDNGLKKPKEAQKESEIISDSH